MREAAFSKQNHEKWRSFEQKLAKYANAHPDELADLFIEITDDLAYAQTYYPKSKTAQYLNELAIRAHQTIYRNKKERSSRIASFWKREIPLAIHAAHKQMLVALVVFVLAIIAGVISTLYDTEFPRYFMGDGYVNRTLENIKNGDPMGIYGSEGETEMFFQITFNNIMVAFRAIAFGILFSVISFYIMLYNGIMVGVFLTFLYNEGYLGVAMRTIWIHGSIEIASIVIAGGAGILLGNSFLFPGTFTRLESFKRGARTAAKIAVGLVPLFIVAGFLESFVTRYYQNMWVGILCIGTTLPVILWYYIYLPVKVFKQYGKES